MCRKCLYSSRLHLKVVHLLCDASIMQPRSADVISVWMASHRGYPAGQACRSCAAGCASCGKNATHCLSCEEPLLLHKHQCVGECPPTHTVGADRECQRCPSACQECQPLGQCTGTETQCKPGDRFS